jgi:hypothetical protein
MSYIQKLSGIMAVVALIGLSFAPITVQAASASVDSNTCADSGGKVIVALNDVGNFSLILNDTGAELDNGDLTGTNTKQFIGLPDGDYTMEIEDGSDINFTVDCEDDPEPVVTIDENSCVAEDGRVKVTFDHVETFSLTRDDSGAEIDSGNVSGINTKTFDGLSDGDYTLTVTASDGDQTHASFSVDCDPEPTPDPEPNISISSQQCIDNDGKLVVDTPNGLDFYTLENTTSGNTIVTDNGGADAGTVSFDNLPDGDYRFEGTLNGVTETLTFTVDCDTVTPPPGPDLSGSCSVSDSTLGLGDNVTFQASATGGESPYSYSWQLEGSDDDDDTKNVTTDYNQTGTYNGTVTITDDAGDSVQKTCSVRVKTSDNNDDNGGGGDKLEKRNDDDDGEVRGDRDPDFAVQCLPERSIYQVGETVVFNASLDGDIDEDDVDFDWSGDGNLDEDGGVATVVYQTGSVKEVRVTAEYDGETESDNCFVQIGAGDGVTLDQVPYTGPADTAKTLGFLSAIMLLALAGGYTVIRRRKEDGIPVGIPSNHS